MQMIRANTFTHMSGGYHLNMVCFHHAADDIYVMKFIAVLCMLASSWGGLILFCSAQRVDNERTFLYLDNFEGSLSGTGDSTALGR